MIQPSKFLRRALLADAVFSGVSALGLTLGADAFASLLSLPEVLLRETGLFLIAYTALVGWLGTRQAVPKALVVLVKTKESTSADVASSRRLSVPVLLVSTKSCRL